MNDSQDMNLAESARLFLASLPSEDAKASQQEIHRFVRWYGGQRPLSGLTAHEVGNYAERLPLSDADYTKKLDQVRAFLRYAGKAGWTRANLSTHLKVKKGKEKTPVSVRPGKASSTTSLTQQGYDGIKAELAAIEEKLAQAIEEVRRAAADKDVRENAPLEAAREQHGQLMGRKKELEEVIKSAVILDETARTTITVSIGSSVLIQDLDSGEELRYKIVSPREVNPARGNISNVSPVGKAVIGQREGGTVEVVTPSGKIRYRIKHIEG